MDETNETNEADAMAELVGQFVFTHVSDAMNYFVDRLKPIPLPMLKEWLKVTNALELTTPNQIAMRVFHTQVIEAYITAREYAIEDHNTKIKNN